VKSKPSKDLLELGKHLVEELGHADRGTTLSRWMAHHLARLMREAEDAKTARSRNAARKAAEKLILELWAQRSSLPGTADPIARYQRAIDTLEVLSQNSLPWRRQSADALHSTIAELHDAVSKLVYGLILSDVESQIPRGKYEELAEPFLETAEERLAYLLGSIRVKITDPAAVGKAQARANTTERVHAAMVSLVEKALKSLGNIRQQLAKQDLDA